MKVAYGVKPNLIAKSNVSIPKTLVFSTTRWTVILNAGDSKSPQHGDALSQLCQTYWYPIYAFVRRKGSSPEDAQDLTQEFSTRLLEKKLFGSGRPRTGQISVVHTRSGAAFSIASPRARTRPKTGRKQSSYSVTFQSDGETGSGRGGREPLLRYASRACPRVLIG